MSKIKRIVIVGNGFDMAHGLETSYLNFVNETRNNPLSVIPQYDELIRKLNICGDKEKEKTWYSFERIFESVVKKLYLDLFM